MEGSERLDKKDEDKTDSASGRKMNSISMEHEEGCAYENLKDHQRSVSTSWNSCPPNSIAQRWEKERGLCSFAADMPSPREKSDCDWLDSRVGQ
jgi:hypothetical protein